VNTNTSNTSNTLAANPLAAAIEEALPPTSTTTLVGNARVAIGAFSKATDAKLIVATKSVLAGMAGNAAYPSPNPKLSDITSTFNNYLAAVNAARDSSVQIVVRGQQRKALVAMLRTLALYVQIASGGDLPTLLSSGFTAQRTRQPVGPLPAPANLRLYRGKLSGQLIARCGRLKQAGAYEWRYATTAAPTAWVEVDSTFAANVVIEGLVPGTQYIVQTRALGTAGPSDWCDAATLMVV
jgi:hypothetical protein